MNIFGTFFESRTKDEMTDTISFNQSRVQRSVKVFLETPSTKENKVLSKSRKRKMRTFSLLQKQTLFKSSNEAVLSHMMSDKNISKYLASPKPSPFQIYSHTSTPVRTAKKCKTNFSSPMHSKKLRSSIELTSVFQRTNKKGLTVNFNREKSTKKFTNFRSASCKELPTLLLEKNFNDKLEDLESDIINEKNKIKSEKRKENEGVEKRRKEMKKNMFKERDEIENLIDFKAEKKQARPMRLLSSIINQRNNNILSKLNEKVLMTNTKFFSEKFGHFDDNLKTKKKKRYKIKFF